jgi:hypothetical protein
MKSLFSWWCLFLGCVSAVAGPREESFLKEKPIKVEAMAKDYRHLFRMLYFPSFPIKDYAFAINVFLNAHDRGSHDSGYVVYKVRIGEKRFEERSRRLTEAEAAGLWETFTREELFSLPPRQREWMAGQTDSAGNTLHSLVFSHYDRKRRQAQELDRDLHASEPATRVQQALAKLVSDLVADVEARPKSS